ncbi:MAG TPA: deoxyhypusine synthase family protein [Thermodesulfobacteriota bacterium]|nr:deoxyhypusine synthase family protein [Thermodesulfobacteriota bacterium]
MMEFDSKKRRRYLKKAVRPVKIETRGNISDLVKRMGETAFQGRNLSTAVDVWEEMLRKRTTVFFGLAGAMVPAGMREVVVYLIKNRYIDCLVSTGANLFHDIHETAGSFHWQGTHKIDDNELREAGIDRMYDVFAAEEEFHESDRYILNFAKTLPRRPTTTREFFRLLGKDLSRRAKKEGIITSAYNSGVPIYCPAVADSSVGIALALEDGPDHFVFDLIGDVKETAYLASSGATGVVFVGGGTPKNFIQQTEVTADLMCRNVMGHKYAVQITADSPHWGGLSGCTFEEAQSWGKIARKSRHVTVNADATIALPVIVTALAQRMKGVKRKPPKMDVTNSFRVKGRAFDRPCKG